MIFDIRCNGQINPINIDRTVTLRWKNDYDLVGFSVCLRIGETVIYKKHVSSSVCYFSYDGELLPCAWYRGVITCYGKNGEEESAEFMFRTALVDGFPPSCEWIGAGQIEVSEQPARGNPATYLQREFVLNKVDESYLHIAGLGLFTLFINGKKVSDDVLTCPFTNYNQSVLYATYDVTSYLTVGENSICAVLGDGWFNQTATDEWGFYKADWRKNAMMCLFLEGAYTLYSDWSWNCSTEGPIRASAIRLGEQVDFSKAEAINFSIPAKKMEAPKGKLKSMQEFPIREVEYIEYKSVKDFNGCLQFDFGESITGYVQLSCCNQGKIYIRYGDRIGSDGKIDNKSNGQYVYEKGFQTDVVIGNGQMNEYKPCFTYHAFRYVEIEGLEYIPSANELRAVLIRSAFKKYGSFTCSNVRLNTLFNMSLRSMECNYTGIPTDCPHREKNGWTGDMQLSCSTYIKNFDLSINLYKWLEDICEAQREDGCIPCIVPTAGWGYTWGNGPAWDFALFALPYQLYVQRGETYAIQLVYETCGRYLEYLCKKEQDNLIELGLGDWNYPKDIAIEICPLELISSCYYYRMLYLYAIFSEVMGVKDMQKKSFKKAMSVKQTIQQKYLVRSGEQLCGMTALAAVLYFDIAEGDEYKKIFERLVQEIESERYRALFGILGAQYVHNVLCKNGRGDIFVAMMECSEYPSFGLWIEKGATALWEDFEGTNSRNHHMFSNIADVMQTYILGIREEMCGEKYLLKIIPYCKDISYMRGSALTVNGVVSVSLINDGSHINVFLKIPFGINAELNVMDKNYSLHGGLNRILLNSTEDS